MNWAAFSSNADAEVRTPIPSESCLTYENAVADRSSTPGVRGCAGAGVPDGAVAAAWVVALGVGVTTRVGITEGGMAVGAGVASTVADGEADTAVGVAGASGAAVDPAHAAKTPAVSSVSAAQRAGREYMSRKSVGK